MITNKLNKTIAAIILATIINIIPVYSSSTLSTAYAAEINGEVTVEAASLWTYNKADWNARAKVVNQGEKFTLSEKITVDGREMYGLTNGFYITANTQYVSATELGNSTPPVTVENTIKVTLENLSMRQGPSTNYTRILIIPKGATVESISSADGWDKIIYEGKTGYSSSAYLTQNQEPPKVETPAPIQKVTTYNVYMRQGPSTSYESIQLIPKGAQVESISSDNGWDLVTYQGKTGYTSSAYLKEGTVEVPKPLITIKQTTVNLSLRQGPATSYDRILVIPQGSQVESISSSDGWDKISYLGTTGYASSSYLTTDTVQESKVTGQDIISFGKTLLGIPYTWGGNNPTEGFDCSGLVKYIYANFGYQTPRVSYQQAAYGREVSMNTLQLGDILYFGNSQVSHVGIYAGNNTMLHAPSPGQFVELRDISWHVNKYNIVGARRYLD